MNRIKIAHVATVDMSIRYMLLNQMLSLQLEGYDLTGISAPGPEIAAVEAAGIRHIPAAMTRSVTPFKDLKALWQLWRIMRRERFTIVHTHTPKAGLLGQLAARLAGVPIVVNTIHGFYFHEHMPPLARRVHILLETIAARCSDLILSQNQEDVQTAVKERICAAGKIRPLGNGFDIREFDRETPDMDVLASARQEFGLKAGTPVIGFVGRLVAEKGILELLEAVQLIVKQIPGVSMLIVGPVDHDKPDAITPRIAHEFGLGDVCIFTGRRHDMPKLYSLMDVAVLPSHREGFPRVPMEASLMGVPSVVTDIRGCREVVQDGVNGLIVPLGDVRALADAVLKILQDPDLARRLGDAGKAMARTSFDEEAVFRKVKATYAELLSQKGLPVPHPGKAALQEA